MLDIQCAVDEHLGTLYLVTWYLVTWYLVHACSGVFDGDLEGDAFCPVADSGTHDVGRANSPADEISTRFDAVLFDDSREEFGHGVLAEGVLRAEFFLAYRQFHFVRRYTGYFVPTECNLRIPVFLRQFGIEVLRREVGFFFEGSGNSLVGGNSDEDDICLLAGTPLFELVSFVRRSYQAHFRAVLNIVRIEAVLSALVGNGNRAVLGNKRELVVVAFIDSFDGQVAGDIVEGFVPAGEGIAFYCRCFGSEVRSGGLSVRRPAWTVLFPAVGELQ